MRSFIEIFTVTKTLQGKPLTKRQRVQLAKFLPMALEPTTHAPAGQKASQLCTDSWTRWRRSIKKYFLIILGSNTLFFLLRERKKKEGKKEKIPRSQVLLWELYIFKNWNVFMLCRSTFLPADPSSPKDRILWQTVLAWKTLLVPDVLLLTQNPPRSHWFWTFLTLFQYSFLLFQFVHPKKMLRKVSESTVLEGQGTGCATQPSMCLRSSRRHHELHKGFLPNWRYVYRE